MNSTDFNTPHGTDYDKPAILIENASQYRPDLINAGYLPFEQKIFFNPLAVSGNFRFRVRHWHWNKHIPATNTGRDVLNEFFIDYGDNSNALHEIDPTNDRITGSYDYSELVNNHYNKCKEEYENDPSMSVEEFYNKLFSFSVTVVFYIKGYEVTAGLYPDDLDALHQQELNGRLGKMYHDLEMNILFPKLTKISYDIFYNYTYFEKNLLKNCDRLLEIDPRTFDTLVDQETLESWFENSGVYRLSSRYFEKMSKVTSIKNICKNSNLQELGFMTFNHLHYINNAKSAFYNSKLRKIGSDLFNIYKEAGDVYCESMFAEIPYQISKSDHCMKYIQTENVIHSLNMWGNVISQTSEDLFMTGLITDGYPINIIYTGVASIDTSNMDCMTLSYEVLEPIELEEICLNIPSFTNPGYTTKLTNSHRLTSRIVIEASFLDSKIAYDPDLDKSFEVQSLLSKRLLPKGKFWIKIYYDKSNADIVGVDLYTRSQHGIIGRDLITNEVKLTLTGILPKSPRITMIEKSYHELWVITNTDTFFSMYTQYEVSGLFADLIYFQSLDEYILNPLVDNTHFEYLIANNKALYRINSIFKTNTKLRSINSAFLNVESYELDPHIFDTTPNLEIVSSAFDKAKNLVINETHVDLFKNTPKITNLNATFRECDSLVSRVYISHLMECDDFRYMYASCKGLIIREDLNWKNTTKNDSVLDKIGNLIIRDEFSIPDYSQLEIKPQFVRLDYMYYNINSSSIIMNPINGVKEIKYYINRMYSNIKSYFDDKFLFRNLDIEGLSYIFTINPTIEYDIVCENQMINFTPAIKAYGMELLSNTNTQVNTSNSYNVFYPEIPENEIIDIIITNHTKNITINTNTTIKINKQNKQVFKRRGSRSKTADNRLSFMYVESSPVYYKETLEIPYHSFNISIDVLRFDDTQISIGDHLTISIKNRFFPISIGNQTISDIRGEFPFSRIELLNMETFKHLILPESLFKHMFLSTNISLNDDYFINNTDNKYVFKNGICFKNILPHLTVLNNLIINSQKLIALTEDMNLDIFNDMNILLAEDTFNNNINQTIFYNIPSLIEMNGTYRNTNVLLNQIESEFPYLKYATYVFENEFSTNANIMLNVPNLEDITGIFKGTSFKSINENPFIGSNIRIANEMFMNSALHTYSHILDTHPVKYIDHLLDGSLVKVVGELIPLNTVISANYCLANCNPNEIFIDFLRRNINCISVKHLFDNTPYNYTIDYISGMTSLMDASYILANTELTQISPTFFTTNINLINLEGALYKHKMNIIPDNLLFGINNLKSLKAFTSQADNLEELPNLGCLIKVSDEVFDFSEFADRCYNADFLHKKITDILYPFSENEKPTINIQNAFNQIKVSYTDNELANGKFLIEGRSNGIYTPNASIDIDGLNEFIINFTHKGNEEKLTFQIWDYNTNQLKTINNATELQKSTRCVIIINDMSYGLNAELDEPLNPQTFPNITLIPDMEYTIKIYTQPYTNPTPSMANGEVLTISNINNNDINTSLSGCMPIGPVENNIRARSLKELLGENVNIVDILNLKLNNRLYNDSVYVSAGYFKELHITSVNLDNILFSPNHTKSMFEDCIYLTTIYITNPIILNGDGVDLSNFFKNCPIEYFPIDRPLSYYFQMLKNEGGVNVINTPINLSNMFNGCKLNTINRILEFISTSDNPISFIKPNNYKDITINLTGMYENSSIENIDNGLIYIKDVLYRTKHPNFILDSLLSKSNVLSIPQYSLVLGDVANLTSFNNLYELNPQLTSIEMPVIKMNWYWDFTEFENECHIEALFRLSTNLEWKRNTIHHLIEYDTEENVPYVYHSYSMLENIISNNPDDRIFRGLVYIGETLVIYQNIGPDVTDMNHFRMIFDMRKLISSDYLFRIYGPTNSVVAFTDLTNSNTSILNSKLYVVVNEDITNAIEYYPDESKNIQMVSVSTNELEQRVLKRSLTPSRNYDEEYDVICLDVYTDNNPSDLEIKELLACFRANQSSLVLGIQIEGSLGYSAKYQSLGLLLVDILGNDAKDKLYAISDDTFINYSEIGLTSSNDLVYNYGKSLLAGITGCETLGVNILKPFRNQDVLIGIFADTAFNSIDENIFNELKVTRLIDLFAGAKVPMNLNEQHFHTLNVYDISGMFYKASRVNYCINTIFNKIPSVRIAKYLYACSDIETPHVDMFRFLSNLENNDYGFYKTSIRICPTIYEYNTNLNSVISLFEYSDIEILADRLLANKSNLNYIDSLVSNCEKLTVIPENIFLNSYNIESANHMAYKTKALKGVSNNLLNSFNNCRYAKHMFDGSGLLEYPERLAKSLISLIDGSYMFANMKDPYSIPDGYLSELRNVNTLKGCFSGEGNLNNVGVDVLPHSSALENIEELFKQKRMITEIDRDYFKYTPNIKSIRSYCEECSSLSKLPNIDYLINLENVSSSHKYNTAIKEIPSRYYYNNRKIYNYEEVFYGDNQITNCGFEIFNFDFSLSENISLISTFDGCSNINLHYNTISSYIANSQDILSTQKLNVDTMFNFVKTFLNEELVWEELNQSKIGDSKLNTTNPPSTDITGLNYIGFELIPAIIPMNKVYKLKTLHDMKIPSDTTSFNGRVVVMLDDQILKAYDNNIYYAEPLEDIILPDDNTHTIKIYTESEKDVVVIHNAGEFLNKLLDNDDILMKLDEMPKVRITGGFNAGLSKIEDFKLNEIFTILEPLQENLIYKGYPIIEITNDIIKNVVSTLPRKNNVSGGFFSELFCETLPDNLLPNKVTSPTSSEYEITEGLICDNPKLLNIPKDILTKLEFTKLTYFIGNCISLTVLPNIIPMQNTIKSLDSMCYNCISLIEIESDFASSLVNVSMNSFLENASKYKGFSEEFINNLHGKINSIDRFAYNSGFELLTEHWIDILENVQSAKYAFAKSQISQIPAKLFSKAIHLRNINQVSAIEGMFSEILALSEIDGNLELLPSNRNLTKLFADSINLNWGNKRVFRQIYLSAPQTAIIDDSFKNISIPLDDDSQLFENIEYSGQSNAIFTGRIPPSTDTSNLSCLTVEFTPTSTHSLQPKIKIDKEIVSLTDTKQLTNRLVFKLYKINITTQLKELVFEIGYDNTYEIDKIKPITVEYIDGYNYQLEIYTKGDYVGFDFSLYNQSKLDGVFPINILNDVNTITPIKDMFGIKFAYLGDNLLNNLNVTSLDLTNTPFNMKEHLVGIGSLLNGLIDQENLDEQFKGCTQLLAENINISNLTKLKSVRYLFSGCTLLNIDITEFLNNLPLIEDITGVLEYSSYHNLTSETFKVNRYLKYAKYFIKDTKTYELPENLFRTNLDLISIAGAFMNCPLNNIPNTLGCNPGCYSIERVYYNCQTINTPLTRTVAELIYDGQSADTVKLLDSFYQVPVSFKSEADFIKSIRFTQGSTGAKFNQ